MNGSLNGSLGHYVDILKILKEKVQNYNSKNSKAKVVAGTLGTVRTSDLEEQWASGGIFLQDIVALGAGSYCNYFSIHVYDGYLYNPNHDYGDTNESEGLFNEKDEDEKAQNILIILKQTDCPLVFWYCYYNPRTEILDLVLERQKNEALHGLMNQDEELSKREATLTHVG
ncbi:MAG: hypothetical protein QG670_1716 [Thermoproteota archaeon]|nr:hypothetical protein [Thermoproteota archaeon]